MSFMIESNKSLHIGAMVIYRKRKFKILNFYLPPTHRSHRVLIQSLDSYNISGKLIEIWCSISDLQIDVEFYRDKKLEEILNI